MREETTLMVWFFYPVYGGLWNVYWLCGARDDNSKDVAPRRRSRYSIILLLYASNYNVVYRISAWSVSLRRSSFIY